MDSRIRKLEKYVRTNSGDREAANRLVNMLASSIKLVDSDDIKGKPLPKKATCIKARRILLDTNDLRDLMRPHGRSYVGIEEEDGEGGGSGEEEDDEDSEDEGARSRRGGVDNLLRWEDTEVIDDVDNIEYSDRLKYANDRHSKRSNALNNLEPLRDDTSIKPVFRNPTDDPKYIKVRRRSKDDFSNENDHPIYGDIDSVKKTWWAYNHIEDCKSCSFLYTDSDYGINYRDGHLAPGHLYDDDDDGWDAIDWDEYGNEPGSGMREEDIVFMHDDDDDEPARPYAYDYGGNNKRDLGLHVDDDGGKDFLNDDDFESVDPMELDKLPDPKSTKRGRIRQGRLNKAKKVADLYGLLPWKEGLTAPQRRMLSEADVGRRGLERSSDVSGSNEDFMRLFASKVRSGGGDDSDRVLLSILNNVLNFTCSAEDYPEFSERWYPGLCNLISGINIPFNLHNLWGLNIPSRAEFFNIVDRAIRDASPSRKARYGLNKDIGGNHLNDDENGVQGRLKDIDRYTWRMSVDARREFISGFIGNVHGAIKDVVFNYARIRYSRAFN